MKSINRKGNEEVMVNVSKEQKWYFGGCSDEEHCYHVFATKVHKEHFGLAIYLFIAYQLFFEDLIYFAQQEDRKVDVMEFLQDSVENNPYLQDSLNKQNFLVKDGHIYTEIENKKQTLVHTGEFIIENYIVNTSFSHMFFTDIATNEQFMYYGD